MGDKVNSFSVAFGRGKESSDNSIGENSVIVKLKEIKRKVAFHEYKNYNHLKLDILELNKANWKNIKSLYKDDLSELTLVHSFLIEEVVKIHNHEESNLNNQLIKNNLNVKHIINEVEDGKLASRIYFFGNEDFEYYYVGDIHSDDYIIDIILEKTDFFKKIVNNNKIRIVFLGDYVDRGKEHLKALEKIMALKYIFPGNIFLLRGNHDGGSIKENRVSLCIRKPERDRDEDYFMLYVDNICKENPSFSRKIIKKYLNLFQSMAVLAFAKVHGKIICAVHGGIPRPLRGEKDIYGYIKSLEDLTNELKINSRGESIISNILWSDPLEEVVDKYEHTRRFGFKEAEFNTYADLFGIDFLIRGHEANEEGVKTFFNERLYCIFGSGSILKNGENINLSTAYPWVKPKILKAEKGKFIKIIDLYGK